MLFTQKPIVVLFSRSHIEVYDLSRNSQDRFSIPPDLYHHGEIIDETKLIDAVKQFLTPLNLRATQAILILDQPLVFSVSLSGKDDKELRDFMDALPIKKEEVATVSREVNHQKTIYATNKRNYEVLISAFSQHNIQISSVVALTVFSYQPIAQSVTIEDVNKLVKEKNAIMSMNYLKQKRLPSEQAASMQESASGADLVVQHNYMRQYVILGVCIFAFLISLVYLLLWSETIHNPWFAKSTKKPPIVKTSTSVTPPQPTLSPSSYSKARVTIQILNGSGIEGQAGKISRLLQADGYELVTTGNSPQNETKSVIRYKTTILKNQVLDIQSAIKSVVSSSSLQEASPAAQYDVVIRTGKEE